MAPAPSGTTDTAHSAAGPVLVKREGKIVTITLNRAEDGNRWRKEMLHEVMAFAGNMSRKGPIALRGAKRIAHARLAPGLREARQLSDELRAKLEWSHDVDEAIAAHREGRKPRFTGKQPRGCTLSISAAVRSVNRALPARQERNSG